MSRRSSTITPTLRLNGDNDRIEITASRNDKFIARAAHSRTSRRAILWLVPVLAFALGASGFFILGASTNHSSAKVIAAAPVDTYDKSAAEQAAINCISAFLNFNDQGDRTKYNADVGTYCLGSSAKTNANFGWNGTGSQKAVNATTWVMPGTGPMREVVVSPNVNGPARDCFMVGVVENMAGQPAHLQVAIGELPRPAVCPTPQQVVQNQIKVDDILSQQLATKMQLFFAAYGSYQGDGKGGSVDSNDQKVGDQMAAVMVGGRPLKGLGGRFILSNDPNEPGIVQVQIQKRLQSGVDTDGDKRSAYVTVDWEYIGAAGAHIKSTYWLILVKQGDQYLIDGASLRELPVSGK